MSLVSGVVVLEIVLMHSVRQSCVTAAGFTASDLTSGELGHTVLVRELDCSCCVYL